MDDIFAVGHDLRPLMSIVPLDGVFVVANFKEVHLRRMSIGQPVMMTADVYCSGAK